MNRVLRKPDRQDKDKMGNSTVDMVCFIDISTFFGVEWFVVKWF